VETTQQGFPVRQAVLIVAGLALLAVAGMLVQDPPAAWEESVFRALNELPHNVEPVLWVLQQMGSALVMPVAAIVLWRMTHRWQPPVALLAAGFLLGWVGAKVVKAMVGRGRPGAIFDDVILGFDVPVAEIGFPSGHAVLAFTLVAVFAPYLSKRGRLVAVGVAIAVGLTRVYVGAHFPLDVIGGAGYGVAIGIFATLVSKQGSGGGLDGSRTVRGRSDPAEG
jgi:undecaprenyl-diphosphatase